MIDLSHVLDLIVGAGIGSAPSIINERLNLARERRAVRTQIAYALRDLERHLTPRPGGDRDALAAAIKSLRDRALSNDVAKALHGREDDIFAALDAAEDALAAIDNAEAAAARGELAISLTPKLITAFQERLRAQDAIALTRIAIKQRKNT